VIKFNPIQRLKTLGLLAAQLKIEIDLVHLILKSYT
jgi:hypothetical protein